MRGAGGTVLAAGESEEFRRISRKAVSRIAEESVLPDVDPRAPSTASEKGAERSGMGEGNRTHQAGQEGRAAVRLCNLAAQSSPDAETRVQAGSREGANREGN